MKRTLQLIFLVLVLSLNHAFSQNISNNTKITKSCSKHKGALRGTLGTYANPPRLEDGRIDQKRLIAELKDIHANTYNWLIRTNNDDLKTFILFLPLAREAKFVISIS